jgi:hypothetical protein
MTLSMVRLLFVIAGLYDFVIGLTFLFFGAQLFDAAGVPQPKHWAYIQFGSLLLMIFGTMFLAIACDPAGKRNLIPYGMMLKLSYARLLREGRILDPGRWDLCTLFDVNIEPKNMTVEELREGMVWLAERLYSEDNLIQRRRPFFDGFWTRRRHGVG